MERISEVSKDLKSKGITDTNIFFVSEKIMDKEREKGKLTDGEVGGWFCYITKIGEKLLLFWELKGAKKIHFESN